VDIGFKLTKVWEKFDCPATALKQSKVTKIQLQSNKQVIRALLFVAPGGIQHPAPGRLLLLLDVNEVSLFSSGVITAVIDVVVKRSSSIMCLFQNNKSLMLDFI
jgi:hypothetical protein